MKKVLSLVAIALMATPVSAAPVVDGTLDASYGGAIVEQSVQTQFGDNLDPNGFGGGGELDAGYARIDSGRLFIMLTGNIEPNFNKVSVFIDSKPGGENVLTGIPNYDGGRSQNFSGLTFDSGFEADYHIVNRWGGGAFEIDLYDRAGGLNASVNGNGGAATVGAGTGIQSGTVGIGDLADDAGATFLTQPMLFGFNNTNIAGVDGGTGTPPAGAAAAVTTGLEISIALADLGNPGVGDTIKIHAAYGNGDNNFHSNQILGGLPAPQGNLGGDGAGGFTGTLGGIDFNNFAGDQFFSITIPVPEPTSLALFGLASMGLVCSRRRR